MQEICLSEGDLDSIPGSGRSPGEGNSNPLQYSCLGNSMEREVWWVTVHGVTRVRHDWSSWAHMHPNIYLFKVYNWMIFNIFTRVCDHHCLVWFTFLNDSSGCCVDGMEWGEEAPSGKPNGSWTKAAVVMGEHRCFWGFQFSKLDTCISYEAGQPDFGSAPFYLP